MNLFVSMLASSALQLVVFNVIPFVWWLVTARNEVNFFEWIGLKKVQSDDKPNLLRMIALVSVVYLLVALFMLYLVRGAQTATSVFEGQGWRALPAGLVYAFLNTALPEEMLFRGFLLKRLAAKVGGLKANFIQALLFGLLHGLMFYKAVGFGAVVAIVIFTGSIGWFMGYINEEAAGGSILPSWLIHGISNTFSAILAMFSMI
ncbi:CPBP family intramembrane glutamic endopeptidase [Fundicoccus culcitae]|uniref:CPBP family intramembrane metalloprotease n=1 Tax=Fundicoccus culcitae TaxID=2969821 RepID=A0ABY5P8L3_9LACT|nr:CPBP family intramembrane glutamic endopeptidase [Fundicoccus culcitae]UUX34758.1 CPBP family intramembrane metalloprotease [Fundicoccus culcitae]